MMTEYVTEFLELAKTMNYNKAAANLYTTQASISRHIMAMEEEMGCKLFIRKSRKIALSEAGRKFLKHAEIMAQLQEEYTEELEKRAKVRNGMLTIGVSAMNTFYTSETLSDFIREYPQIHINIVEDRSTTLLNYLNEKKCDFIFVPRNSLSIDEGIQSMEYYKAPIVAVVPISNPLAKNDKIKFSQLKKEKFVLQPPGNPIHDLCMERCKKEGFEPEIACSCITNSGIIEFVRKERGIGFLLKRTAVSLKRSGVEIIDIEPSVFGYIDLIYNKSTSVTKNNFLRFIRSYIKDQKQVR